MNVAGSSLIKYNLSGNKLSSFVDYVNLLLKPGVLLGFVSIFLSALVMFKALSVGKFSVIGPLATGINFMFTIAVGVMFFNDKLSFQAYVGLVLILVGITLISIKA